jgi:hypothetical protein
LVRFSATEFEEILGSLWTAEEIPPCAIGVGLLRAFAEARPTDFSFLKAQDMVYLRNSAFQGIPEWDAFTDHFSACPSCNEHDEVS